jgi:hypothetical protein
MTPDQAIGRISELKGNEEWRQSFLAGDISKRDEWAKLHEAANRFDAPDVVKESKAKLEREQIVDQMARTADISDDVKAMVINNTAVTAHERNLAEQEKAKLLADPEWTRSWLAGNRAARTRMVLVNVILARPVQG